MRVQRDDVLDRVIGMTVRNKGMESQVSVHNYEDLVSEGGQKRGESSINCTLFSVR